MNMLPTKNECPHLSTCSGCDQEATLLPPPIWKQMEEYFLTQKIKPSFFHKELKGWRLRAKLAVREEKGKLLIGLFEKKTHHVRELSDCYAHHPLINEALVVLKKILLEWKISGYQEKENRGSLRYLQLTVSRKTPKVQLVFVVNEKVLSSQWKALAHYLFSKQPIWHSIWVNLQPSSTNTIFGSSWHLLEGEEFLFEEVEQEKIAFHPAAFFQAHQSLFEEMVASIKRQISPCETLVEFYAGVGVIGKCLRDKAKTIFFVEANPFAQKSFLASLSSEAKGQKSCTKGITADSYFSCDVEEKASLCKEADLIIVDPPRKGLSSLLLEEICQKKKGELIYVSCYFPSFKRDLEKLSSFGWKVEKVEGYLLFPGTNHVETLAFLKKE
jgi:23S rRNA (uracil1939-C5)-methyltransferase